MIEDFNDAFVQKLTSLANNLDFIIFEDRYDIALNFFIAKLLMSSTHILKVMKMQHNIIFMKYKKSLKI